jgi:hypothetical protein
MNALAPEHLADLHASGLSAATIEALRCESIRPADIPVRKAESAYKLPYFNLDGSVNCFSRVKLVPAVKDRDGHTQKYWQQPGSQPGLYLPPTFFNWQTVAHTAATVLVITEGEKKAAAACQAGLCTAGVGGVWNWTATITNGERLVLPAFDAFQWTGRPILICPDSDAWHEGKELKVLAGFFALAKELEQRGACVQFVVLPDVHGGKGGLDDWLLVPGNEAEHGWAKLERISLSDVRFADLTAWWQSWKAKHSTHAALKAHDLDELELTETAGLYAVRSVKDAARLTFDRLAEQRGGVTAEVTVVLGSTELLSGVDLGLKSDSGQTKLASSLKALAPSIPWKLLLQKSCSFVLNRYREGEPLRVLTVDTPVDPLTFQVNPLVFRGKPTVLFGDGGLGKSSLALLCAMLVSTGETVAGIAALRGVSLYLDYEDSYDVHVRRMQAIAASHPALAQADVRYQACTEPLANLTHMLLRRVQAEGITFLVLDSLAASTGGDAGPEAATKIFRAIRTLNVGGLIIAHVAKAPADGHDPSIYGSVFHKNFARSTWELRKEQEVGNDTAIPGLFNRKSNLSRQHHPIGLKVTQNSDNTTMHYQPYDLSQAAELATALPLPNRIRNLLATDGVPRSSREIAEELGAKLESVKATLSKHGGTKWHRVGENKDAKWTVLNR